MPATDLGGGLVVHQRRANAGHLVGRDRHADSRCTDEDSPLRLAVGHGASNEKRVIRVVARLAPALAQASDFMSLGPQMLNQDLPDFNAVVIRSQRDLHRQAVP